MADLIFTIQTGPNLWGLIQSLCGNNDDGSKYAVTFTCAHEGSGTRVILPAYITCLGEGVSPHAWTINGNLTRNAVLHLRNKKFLSAGDSESTPFFECEYAPTPRAGVLIVTSASGTSSTERGVTLHDYVGYREFMAWGNEQGISLQRMSHIWTAIVQWNKHVGPAVDHVTVKGENHGREFAFNRRGLQLINPDALRVLRHFGITEANAEVFERFQLEYLAAGRTLPPLSRQANDRRGRTSKAG